MSGHFRELPAWKKAMELVTEVYRATQSFPRGERAGLVAQMRQAAVCVPSQIASGEGRATVPEFHECLGRARGHLYETKTQVEIAGSLGYLDRAEAKRLLVLCEEVATLLNVLMRSLRNSTN